MKIKYVFSSVFFTVNKNGNPSYQDILSDHSSHVLVIKTLVKPYDQVSVSTYILNFSQGCISEVLESQHFGSKESSGLFTTANTIVFPFHIVKYMMDQQYFTWSSRHPILSEQLSSVNFKQVLFSAFPLMVIAHHFSTCGSILLKITRIFSKNSIENTDLYQKDVWSLIDSKGSMKFLNYFPVNSKNVGKVFQGLCSFFRNESIPLENPATKDMWKILISQGIKIPISPCVHCGIPELCHLSMEQISNIIDQARTNWHQDIPTYEKLLVLIIEIFSYLQCHVENNNQIEIFSDICSHANNILCNNQLPCTFGRIPIPAKNSQDYLGHYFSFSKKRDIDTKNLQKDLWLTQIHNAFSLEEEEIPKNLFKVNNLQYGIQIIEEFPGNKKPETYLEKVMKELKEKKQRFHQDLQKQFNEIQEIKEKINHNIIS